MHVSVSHTNTPQGLQRSLYIRSPHALPIHTDVTPPPRLVHDPVPRIQPLHHVPLPYYRIELVLTILLEAQVDLFPDALQRRRTVPRGRGETGAEVRVGIGLDGGGQGGGEDLLEGRGAWARV